MTKAQDGGQEGAALAVLVVEDARKHLHSHRWLPGGDEADHERLLDGMCARYQQGQVEHGVASQADDGRDALLDAYQDTLDACACLRESIGDTAGGRRVYLATIELAFAVRRELSLRRYGR